MDSYCGKWDLAGIGRLTGSQIRYWQGNGRNFATSVGHSHGNYSSIRCGNGDGNSLKGDLRIACIGTGLYVSGSRQSNSSFLVSDYDMQQWLVLCVKYGDDGSSPHFIDTVSF